MCQDSARTQRGITYEARHRAPHAPRRPVDLGRTRACRRAHDRRQRREGRLGRRRQGGLLAAGQGHRLDHRHRQRPPGAAGDREPSAHELDLRPAREPGHHARRAARDRGELDDVGAGGQRLEADARQQALRDRPQGQPAEAHRHRRDRQAALGALHQLTRRPRAGGQPRRQLDQRAVDCGQRGEADRHRADGRAGGAHRLHARRQARAGREVSRPQDRRARRERPQGDLLEVRHAGRAVAVQHRRHSQRQAGDHRRQRQRRLVRRSRRHRQHHRPRGHSAARHRPGRRR